MDWWRGGSWCQANAKTVATRKSPTKSPSYSKDQGGEGPTDTMESVALGDCMVLKRGVSQIVAAGTVVEREGRFRGVGDKPWLRDFDGWDLPAYCYVDWRVPEKPLNVSGLLRGTLLALKQEHLKVIAVPPALPRGVRESDSDARLARPYDRMAANQPS